MIARDKKKLEEIKSMLFSSDNKQIIKAIDRLDECPVAELVQPLLVLYARNKDEVIQSKLAEILSTLKISGLEDMFLKAIQAQEFRHCRKDIIHFMWSSNVQPEEGWMHIAEIAASGSYEECIEVLSLLDNTEQELLEEELLESISIIKTALNDHPNDSAVPLRAMLLEGFKERLNQ